MTIKIVEEFDTDACRKEMEEALSNDGVSKLAAEGIRDIFKKMEDEIHSLQSEVEERGDAVEELEQAEDPSSDAINALLDLVDRPVGTLRACLPQTPASERALIALFDSSGRTL